MLSESDKNIILEKSQKYEVKKIFLFGSSSKNLKEPNDIDLAVEGLNPRKFFSFYSELMFSLSKPVDLCDLNDLNKFSEYITNSGILIYDKSKS